MKERVELYNVDYEQLLKTKIQDKLDIIYIDPPYDSDFVIKSIKMIIQKNIIHENTKIIIETDDEQKVLKQLEQLNVEIIDKRKYGRAILIFLRYQNKNA